MHATEWGETPAVSHYGSDGVVDRYASLREDGLFEQEREALERGFFDADAPVLDIGCGAGRTTAALAERGYDVVGVDISAPMVRAADAATDASCLAADATRLPFRDGEFGTVLFSYNGLDDLFPESNRYAALGEINRVLADDGLFVFSAHNSRRLALVYPPTPAELRGTVAFWARNLASRCVGTPYKLAEVDGGTYPIYHITPPAQRRQLRAFGFEPITTLGRAGTLSRLFGPTVYYVARKEAA